MNNNFDCKVKDVVKDTQGSIIIIAWLTMDKEITSVNIHGPSRDEPQFYERLQEQLTERRNLNINNSRGLDFCSNP